MVDVKVLKDFMIEIYFSEDIQ